MENRRFQSAQPERKPIERPIKLFRQVMENKKILESVITPHGDERTYRQVVKAIKIFNREESTAAAQMLIGTMAHERKDRLEAAKVLFSHINLLKVEPAPFIGSYTEALSQQSDTPDSSKNRIALREAKDDFENAQEIDKEAMRARKIINKPITEMKLKKILLLIKENPSITNQELAEKTKCAIRTIKQYKQRLRIEGEDIPSKPGRRATPHIQKRREDLKTVLEANPNATNRELADLVNCSKQDIENDLAQMARDGIVFHSRTPKRRGPSVKILERRGRIEQQLVEGKSYEQILKKEHCSLRTLQRDVEWLEMKNRQH